MDGVLVPYKLLTLVVMDEKLVHHAEDKLRSQGSTTAYHLYGDTHNLQGGLKSTLLIWLLKKRCENEFAQFLLTKK